MGVTLFYITSFFIMLDGRMGLIASRSAYGNRDGLFRISLNFIGTLVALSVIVWGFINMAWWIPIVTLLGMSIPAGFLITNRTLGFFTAVHPLIYLVIISLGAFIWFG